MEPVVLSSWIECEHNHLGDKLASAFYTSRRLDGGDTIIISDDFRTEYREIFDIFERDFPVKFERKTPTLYIDDLFNRKKPLPSMWDEKAIPTKIKWKGGGMKKIAYCFEANYYKDIKIHPTWKDLIGIGGFEWVKLGLPMTPLECIETASECDLYVGADNGIGHLMRCLKIPMALLEHIHDITLAFRYSEEYTLCRWNSDVYNFIVSKSKKFSFTSF